MPIRGPKVKISRALNLALTPKAARIMERRAFSPGQHGAGRKRSPSVYKMQMVEKQRLKFTYNISEAHLRKAYAKAGSMAGATGSNLVSLLERRLDAAVLRMGFAKTCYAARQYCAHGHFEVNGSRAFNGSQLLNVGDVVSVREKSQNHGQIKEAAASAPTIPPYLEVEADKLTGKLISIPERDQVPVEVTEQLVVEFYSR
jgi:small subunit ribosomal protein S4